MVRIYLLIYRQPESNAMLVTPSMKGIPKQIPCTPNVRPWFWSVNVVNHYLFKFIDDFDNSCHRVCFKKINQFINYCTFYLILNQLNFVNSRNLIKKMYIEIHVSFMFYIH